MSYVRAFTICLLLVYFVSAARCHCFDLLNLGQDWSQKADFLKFFSYNITSWLLSRQNVDSFKQEIHLCPCFWLLAVAFSQFGPILFERSLCSLKSTLRWSETKNLKNSIPDNTFFLYLIIMKLCTLKQLENIHQKLKLEFS